jgi:DNA polymerase IIIc chi subunit
VVADSAAADAGDGDVLVNLALDAPLAEGWSRVAEVVDADAGRRARGRERFRAWRERGLEPKTHEMGRGS